MILVSATLLWCYVSCSLSCPCVEEVEDHAKRHLKDHLAETKRTIRTWNRQDISVNTIMQMIPCLLLLTLVFSNYLFIYCRSVLGGGALYPCMPYHLRILHAFISFICILRFTGYYCLHDTSENSEIPTSNLRKNVFNARSGWILSIFFKSYIRIPLKHKKC